MSHHRIPPSLSKVTNYDDQGNMSSGLNIHEEAAVKRPIKKNWSQANVYLCAGSAAGIMEHCLMYPVDSVKTRMQSLHPHPNATYTGIKHAFSVIIKTEGLFRPIRGINIVAVGAGPAHALYFCSYESTKQLLASKFSGISDPITQVLSAAVATFFHDGVMNPVEVIKQRIQVYDSPYRGVYDCAKDIFKREGFGAFYRSFSTTLTMNLPFQCLHFVTYEFMRKTLNPSEEYNPKVHLIAGGAAGGLAAAVTSPLDVAKTLLNTQEKCALKQSQNLVETKILTEQRINIRGMFNALRTIYVQRGFTGYFRGVRARVLFQIPSTAVSWSVYEFFKYYLSLQISMEEMIDLTK